MILNILFLLDVLLDYLLGWNDLSLICLVMLNLLWNGLLLEQVKLLSKWTQLSLLFRLERP